MKLHYRLAWHFLLALARVLWGFRRKGIDEIPDEGPVIIACNHISNWDPILVGLGCRREVHFMAKEELFENRFLGWLIKTFNAIPVRRGAQDTQVFRKASEVLRGAGVLVIFPGGRREQSGKVLAPKSGVGFIACMNEAPVVPAYITGSNTLGRAFVRRRRVEVAFGPAIPAAHANSSDEYRELSRKVAEAIGTLGREVDGR